MAHLLGHNRTWLIAHDDHKLTNSELKLANNLVVRRQAREPLAYILGYREFYGRNFSVTPDVLIPRPETEQLVAHILNLNRKNILDVGTGSGVIAVTLALELPSAQVAACDISPAALNVARKNAHALGANVEFIESNLLKNVAKKFDIIVANLPYVAHGWQVSPETSFEPELALYAENRGEALMRKLILETPKNLKPNGILALELDPRQTENIANFAVKSQHFTVLQKAPFLLILQMK